ncbi:MAG: hypothetical protein ACI8RZ_007926 [Myxococcota bacterium]|jgi:hypothetical protein
MIVLLSSLALADPCGMVPPLSIPGTVQRDGVQRTYVMHRDGVEVIALRPGFIGDVSEFGMLIPFPTPPQITKTDDDLFAHLEAAIDPPELTVNIRRMGRGLPAIGAPAPQPKSAEAGLVWTGVDLLREEAVGMYQVAVLKAGSTAALSAWMGESGYRYPDGMDAVVGEYIAKSWAFVAVKARVGGASGIAPQPGMRSADTSGPVGGSFDGHVQGMAFRFTTPELVIPMRLSVFNGADPRNVVYVLAEDPVRLEGVSTDLVTRQLPGQTLLDNLTTPLPITVTGGRLSELSDIQHTDLAVERDPVHISGLARTQLAADLHAATTGRLSLAMDSEAKALLGVSEAFGMRGPEVDALHAAVLSGPLDAVVEHSLSELSSMWMTVIDGVIPSDVLAGQDLTVARYRMPTDENLPREDPLRVAERRIFMDVW